MFRNMRLSFKLTLGFALVLLLSTVATVSGLIYLNRAADSTRQLYDHPYTVHTEILKIQGNIVAIDRHMKDIALTNDQKAVQSWIAKIDELEADVFEAFDLLYDRFRGDPLLLDDALRAVQDWRAVRDEILRLENADLKVQASEVRRGPGAEQVQLIEQHIQTVVDLARDSAGRFNVEAAQEAAHARTLVLIILAVAYVMAVLAGVVITRSITRPLAGLLSFAHELGDGNLTIADADYKSRDEIGVLTQAMNGMKRDWRDLVTRATNSAAEVSTSSEQMSAVAQQSSASVEELAGAANEFATAVDRLNNNVRRMSDSSDKTSELSQRGAVEIDRSIRAMSEINEVVTELAQEIRNLGRQSEEIGHIVTLITGIAEQTNLLALNAAIEAARVGEQGRGFAVVAEEVRSLAEQSGRAADEITQLIRTIRDSAQNSVARTDLGAEKVKEGMEVVSAGGEMFAGITRTIEELVQEITEVAAASQELAAGAEEISATTEEQSASAQEMASSAVEVANAAAAVDAQLRRLRL